MKQAFRRGCQGSSALMLFVVPVMLVVLALFAGTAAAIEITSDVRGRVTDDRGNPLADAQVTLRQESTALTRTTSTNAAGQFSFRNLPVGTDYLVSASRSGYESGNLSDLALVLGRTTDLSFRLVSRASIEEVVVTGERPTAQVALGPSAAFGLQELERAPAINRNITDIIRIDPRVYVDESRGSINAIQCGGKNSRFNSLNVDGVPTNDLFGLNSNGYPTERAPFPYDAIEQVSVELAPFHANYGGFTACNINAVTKSGTNERSFSIFYDYSDSNLRGKSLEGEDIQSSNYNDTRKGFTFGGAVVQDTFFYHLAYAKWEGNNLFDRGPIGSGAVNEVAVTQAELDEIAKIAREKYKYDPGAQPTSLPNTDEKILLKLDWYVSESHRLAYTYSYNDGHNFSGADTDLDEYEFQNHLYERGAKRTSSIVALYSDWTGNFSTQFRFGQANLDNRQISVGGTDFGEIRVELDKVNVFLGGDDSRQANDLEYDTTSFSFIGDLVLGNHELNFGIERSELDIFNLFVQHAETEIRFDGIENFRKGFADAIYYNNAPSGNPADAAADWGYEITTWFAQDEFVLMDNLTIVAGLRYDRYTTSDRPVENPDFVYDYGFSNTATLDGEALLQPRIGFTYYKSDALTLRGGLGLYSGGDPNVWLSNSFSNNNVLQFGQRGRSFGYTDGSRSLFDPDVAYLGVESGPGVPAGAGPGWGVPSELYNAVAGGMGDNFEINYLDPDFELPSEWKLSFGFTYDFDSGLRMDGDLLWTQGKDSAIVLRGDLERVGRTAAGYPQYQRALAPDKTRRESSFVLTNSDEGNRSLGVYFNLSQSHDNGMDWTLGYAYTDAKDVSPMTSSVAFSNYINRAFFDPQEDVLSTSNYNIRHRFTGTWTWELDLFGGGGYTTTFSLFGTAREGPPFSYAYNGTSDPYNFTPWLDNENNVLRPGDERNEHEGSWWVKFDFKVEQEFKVGQGTAAAFLVIDNLTNLLNDEWGVLRQVNFPNTVEAGEQTEARIGDASRYEVRIGLRYGF